MQKAKQEIKEDVTDSAVPHTFTYTELRYFGSNNPVTTRLFFQTYLDYTLPAGILKQGQKQS